MLHAYGGKDQALESSAMPVSPVWARVTRDLSCATSQPPGLTNTAVAEVEALSGAALDLRIEVDKEGADGVLVGLRHPPPEVVVPLHNLVPLALGLIAAHRGQPVRKELPHRLALQQEEVSCSCWASNTPCNNGPRNCPQGTACAPAAPAAANSDHAAGL